MIAYLTFHDSMDTQNTQDPNKHVLGTGAAKRLPCVVQFLFGKAHVLLPVPSSNGSPLQFAVSWKGFPLFPKLNDSKNIVLAVCLPHSTSQANPRTSKQIYAGLTQSLLAKVEETVFAVSININQIDSNRTPIRSIRAPK